MELFEVIILRTERIAFRLEAESAAQAEADYLMLGDEVGSETVSLQIESTTRVSEE